MAPLGEVERLRRVVRFARSMQRRSRVLGGPSVRAAFGGDLKLAWWPRSVVRHDQTCAGPPFAYARTLPGYPTYSNDVRDPRWTESSEST